MVRVTVLDRLLVERRRAACRIEGRRDQIPLARQQHHGRPHRRDGPAVADAELERAARTDAERIAAPPRDRPSGQQALGASLGRPRPDERPQGEGTGGREPAFRVGDADEAADLCVLRAHGVDAVDRRLDRTLDEARPVRVLVAVDQAHEPDLRLRRALGAHHEIEPLPRLGTEAVAIARQSGLRHCPCPSSQDSVWKSYMTRQP